MTTFPLRGKFRTNALLAAVRKLDALNMSTPEVAEAILAEVPDATVPEMIAALHQVGNEELAEASALERKFNDR